MTIDLSWDGAPDTWAALPTHDRAMVGGATVWLGDHADPLVVCQPNRSGLIQAAFPSVPCLVEADAELTMWLPLPPGVVGWIDRRHRPIPSPRRTRRGREVMRRAERLGARLCQIRGVSVAWRPFARSIPLITPLPPELLSAAMGSAGMTGIAPIPGLAGGVTVAVRSAHTDEDHKRVARVLEETVLDAQ